MKTDDFETIVHARDKEVVLAFGGWMPLDPPGSTSDVHVCQRFQGPACVKKPNFVVITTPVSLLPQIPSSATYLPAAIRCSICGWLWIVVTPASNLSNDPAQLPEYASCFVFPYRLLTKMGRSKPCRSSQPFIERSSPPDPKD